MLVPYTMMYLILTHVGDVGTIPVLQEEVEAQRNGETCSGSDDEGELIPKAPFLPSPVKLLFLPLKEHLLLLPVILVFLVFPLIFISL